MALGVLEEAVLHTALELLVQILCFQPLLLLAVAVAAGLMMALVLVAVKRLQLAVLGVVLVLVKLGLLDLEQVELLGKAVRAVMEVQTIERVVVEEVLLLLAQMLLLPLAAKAGKDAKEKGDVKDKLKAARLKGQSAHARWKSEGEMLLRQQYD